MCGCPISWVYTLDPKLYTHGGNDVSGVVVVVGTVHNGVGCGYKPQWQFLDYVDCVSNFDRHSNADL